MRYERQERLEDHSLCDAIERAERGLVDADLGGGIIKQRVARTLHFNRLCVSLLLKLSPHSCQTNQPKADKKQRRRMYSQKMPAIA